MTDGNPCDDDQVAEVEVEHATSGLLRALIYRPPSPAAPAEAPAGVVIGSLVGLADAGALPLVIYAGQPGSAALPARTTVDLRERHVGAQVVLMFEANDPAKPVVMGILRETATRPAERSDQVEVDADGARLVLTARDEVVLRCGEASITLTRAGKVLIRGTYILSRSNGMNRIVGGTVQIN